jgi:uncharacterized RDD family membrane protein YckC
MADQHGSGPLTPGDPLGGGGQPPPAEPPPAEERRREWAAADEPRPEPAPAEERRREWAAAEPEPAARPVEPAPAFSPPTAPGYGTSPVPPGAFAPPSAAAAHEPWVLAEWWRRAVAAIIDGVIVTIAVVILLIPLAAVGLSVDTDGGAVAFAVGLLVVVLALVVASFLYAPVLMARTNGQTVGKMAVDIRVVRASGRRMDFGWAFLREVVVKAFGFGILSSFTFGLASLLDYLWPLWDSENRALHDFAVDTRVIRG